MPGDFGLATSTTSPLEKTMVSNQKKNSCSTELKQIMEIKKIYQIKLCKKSVNTESRRKKKLYKYEREIT